MTHCIYICVCICICMCIYIAYICVCICMCKCTCIYVNVCVCANVYVCVCTVMIVPIYHYFSLCLIIFHILFSLELLYIMMTKIHECLHHFWNDCRKVTGGEGQMHRGYGKSTIGRSFSKRNQGFSISISQMFMVNSQ